MSKVVMVRLIFENMDYIDLVENDIIRINLDDISYRISNIMNDDIRKKYFCNKVYLKINNPKNLRSYYSQNNFEDMNLLERFIRYSDIVSLELTYNDGSKEYYCVDWNYEDEYDNTYQKINIGENFDSLDVLISRNETLVNYL